MKLGVSKYGYILFTVLFWSSTAAVSKLLLQNLSTIQLLFHTFLLASVSLFLIILFQKKLFSIKTYSLRDYFTLFYMGFLGVFFYTYCLFEAINYLTAHEAFIINYLWPIFVVVFSSFLFKEQLSRKQVLGIISSFFGVLVIFTRGDIVHLEFSSITGTLYALAGAIAYGLYSTLGKEQRFDKYLSTMFNYLFATLIAGIFLVVSSKYSLISLPQLIGVSWLGIFANGLAFAFWFQALKSGDTIKLANFVYLTPFLSLIYTSFILGEEILVSSYIGLVFILLGILIQLSPQ